MSKSLTEILDSLKNRPEEWTKKNNDSVIYNFKYVVAYYGFDKTETVIQAFKKTSRDKIFLSHQNKWVLERAVQEWLERNNKK